MNNSDLVYVGWIQLPITDLKLANTKNIKVFTNKNAARKWKNKLNMRNQKTLWWMEGNHDQYSYTEAGFDEVLIDRESK